METRQLLHFLAAVEHGSFHKAAEALNVSQPALTKSIRRLETTLGLTLFERHTRGISPTPYGDALASHGALIATDLQHAVQVVKDMQRAVLGTIRIGAGPSMGVALLPAVTSALLTQQPGIRLQVRNGLNDTLLAALQRQSGAQRPRRTVLDPIGELRAATQRKVRRQLAAHAQRAAAGQTHHIDGERDHKHDAEPNRDGNEKGNAGRRREHDGDRRKRP